MELIVVFSSNLVYKQQANSAESPQHNAFARLGEWMLNIHQVTSLWRQPFHSFSRRCSDSLMGFPGGHLYLKLDIILVKKNLKKNT